MPDNELEHVSRLRAQCHTDADLMRALRDGI